MWRKETESPGLFVATESTSGESERSRIDPNAAGCCEKNDGAEKQEEERKHGDLLNSLCSHRRALLGNRYFWFQVRLCAKVVPCESRGNVRFAMEKICRDFEDI